MESIKNIISKNSIFKSTKANSFLPQRVSTLCFTSAASDHEFSQTTDGKKYSKAHGTPIAEAGKRVSEMAGKFEESIEDSMGASAEGRNKETKEKESNKVKETLKNTWNMAEEATERVVGKAKKVVEDVMRPAEEHREKVVDPREIDAVRRPLDEGKH